MKETETAFHHSIFDTGKYRPNTLHKVVLSSTGYLLVCQNSDDYKSALTLFRGSAEACNDFCNLPKTAQSVIEYEFTRINKAWHIWKGAYEYQVSVKDEERAKSAKEIPKMASAYALWTCLLRRNRIVWHWRI